MICVWSTRGRVLALVVVVVGGFRDGVVWVCDWISGWGNGVWGEGQKNGRRRQLIGTEATVPATFSLVPTLFDPNEQYRKNNHQHAFAPSVTLDKALDGNTRKVFVLPFQIPFKHIQIRVFFDGRGVFA